MQTIIFMGLLLIAKPSFAQNKTPTKAADPKSSQIQMHEQMSKVHQQAADCLKSGKPEEECHQAFYETCKEQGGPKRCGPWMMHQKMWNKTK